MAVGLPNASGQDHRAEGDDLSPVREAGPDHHLCQDQGVCTSAAPSCEYPSRAACTFDAALTCTAAFNTAHVCSVTGLHLTCMAAEKDHIFPFNVCQFSP